MNLFKWCKNTTRTIKFNQHNHKKMTEKQKYFSPNRFLKIYTL